MVCPCRNILNLKSDNNFQECYYLLFLLHKINVYSVGEQLSGKLVHSFDNTMVKFSIVGAQEMCKHVLQENWADNQNLWRKWRCLGNLHWLHAKHSTLSHTCQRQFHYRQLWDSVFHVHNLKNHKSAFFSYHEDKCRKDPNEMYFFLSDCLEKDMCENVMQLHIFCDGCTVQCQSHTVNVTWITEHRRMW
jgi:hypothetical protein